MDIIDRLKKAKNKLSPEAKIAVGTAIVAVPPYLDPTDVIGAGMVADGLNDMNNQRKVKIYRGLNFERRTTDWAVSPTEMAEEITDRTLKIDEVGVCWTSDFDVAEMFACSREDPDMSEYRPFDSARGVIVEGIVSEKNVVDRFALLEEGGESEVRVEPGTVKITKIYIPMIKRISPLGEVKGDNWKGLLPTSENLKHIQKFIDDPSSLPVKRKKRASTGNIKKYMETVRKEGFSRQMTKPKKIPKSTRR